MSIDGASASNRKPQHSRRGDRWTIVKGKMLWGGVGGSGARARSDVGGSRARGGVGGRGARRAREIGRAHV